VRYQSVPAVNVDLPDGHREEVDVDADDAEHRGQERQDKVDVALDPAEVGAAIDGDVVEQGVHKQGEENHKEGGNVAEQVVLDVSAVVRLLRLPDTALSCLAAAVQPLLHHRHRDVLQLDLHLRPQLHRCCQAL